jgi:hypothetical protein
MRATIVLVAAALLALPLAATLDGASAFGWCTRPGVVPGHACHTYAVCIGWSYDSYGERCQIGIPQCWDICQVLA